MVFKRILAVILLLGCVGLTPLSSTAQIGTTYDIDVAGSIDTPQRTFTVENTEFQVSSIAALSPGDTIQVDVTAPEDEIYSVYLYNSERDLMTAAGGEGSEQVEMETTGLKAGTFLLAIYRDGQYESVYPIVLSRYTVSLNVPATIQPDESAQLRVSVTGSDKSPSKVNVVLANSETSEHIRATKQSEGTYVATVSGDSIVDGEYSVYAAAHGNNEIDGKKEILGLSDAKTIQVQAESAQSEDGGIQDSGPSESTTRSLPTTTVTLETTITSATQTTTQALTSSTTENTRTTTMPTPTTEPSVITANPTQTTETLTTSSSGQPGFGFLGALSVLFVAFLATRYFSR